MIKNLQGQNFKNHVAKLYQACFMPHFYNLHHLSTTMQDRIYKRYRTRPVASLREVDNLFPFPGYVVVPPVLMYYNSDEGCVCQIVNYSKPVHPLPPSVHLGIKMSLLAKKKSGFQGQKQLRPNFHIKFRNAGAPPPLIRKYS